MLTVKLVEKDSEQIHEAVNVWTSPNDTNCKVLAELADGRGTLQFGTTGVIYVMNADGHTVARYDLAKM